MILLQENVGGLAGLIFSYWWLFLLLIIIFSGLFTINQGYIGVITMFGKYQRIVSPGLNIKIPILEQVFKKISYQNRSVELEFQAITSDQANGILNQCCFTLCRTQQRKPLKKWPSNLSPTGK